MLLFSLLFIYLFLSFPFVFCVFLLPKTSNGFETNIFFLVEGFEIKIDWTQSVELWFFRIWSEDHSCRLALRWLVRAFKICSIIFFFKRLWAACQMHLIFFSLSFSMKHDNWPDSYGYLRLWDQVCETLLWRRKNNL